MVSVSTTKLSSKGQVVIPEDVRKRLGLRAGDQFIVLGNDDAVILKSISPPSMADFDSLIETARKQARAARMKRSDVSKAISKVRGRK
ncbi:MAG: AbrB/MazE/SpoVT family DNA-binding domain-containing protein [Verrucomicrobia bacterium]|nr:AbrB/MazE/SpoVT family DNA-binding domain-containing protein [Verrucomicrobiota bacterium]